MPSRPLGTTPVAVLVVVADGPEQVTRREDSLSGSTMDWCRPGADLGTGSWDLVLLANSARTPEMTEWVAAQIPGRIRPGGHYQWRDAK